MAHISAALGIYQFWMGDKFQLAVLDRSIIKRRRVDLKLLATLGNRQPDINPLLSL